MTNFFIKVEIPRAVLVYGYFLLIISLEQGFCGENFTNIRIVTN